MTARQEIDTLRKPGVELENTDLERFVSQYCSGLNYHPASIETYHPNELGLPPDNSSTETWIAVENTKPDRILEAELLTLVRSATSLKSSLRPELPARGVYPKFHLCFLPQTSVGANSKISGGDNVIYKKPTFQPGQIDWLEYVLFLVQNDQLSGNLDKIKSLGVLWHEMAHSVILADFCEDESVTTCPHPNHLHALLDEGMAVVAESIYLASIKKRKLPHILDDSRLAIYFKDPFLFNAVNNNRHNWGALLLPQEVILQRGYSEKAAGILQEIEKADIDLLDPEITESVNFRQSARLDPKGQITPPFVDQDAVILFAYPIGASMVWALSEINIRNSKPPFTWFSQFMSETQAAYTRSDGSGVVDFRQIIEKQFPGTSSKEVNARMIELLKGAIHYAGVLSGHTNPDRFLAEYIREYEKLLGLPKQSDELMEGFASSPVILPLAEIEKRRRGKIAAKVHERDTFGLCGN